MVNIIKIFPNVPTTMIVMMTMITVMILMTIVIVSLSALSILGAGALIWDPGPANIGVSSFEILRSRLPSLINPSACWAQMSSLRVVFPFER